MATVTQTTTAPAYNGYTTDSMRSYIDSLIAAIQPGMVVQASHYNSLVTLVNALISHTHTVTDVGYVAYGNKAAHGSTSYTTATGPLYGAVAYQTAVNSSEVITSTKVNQLIQVLNTLRTHYHAISDNTD